MDAPVPVPYYSIDSSIDVLLGENALSILGCSFDYAQGIIDFRQRALAAAPLQVSNADFLKMFELGLFKETTKILNDY